MSAPLHLYSGACARASRAAARIVRRGARVLPALGGLKIWKSKRKRWLPCCTYLGYRVNLEKF
jgi:hypothetical protein